MHWQQIDSELKDARQKIKRLLKNYRFKSYVSLNLSSSRDSKVIWKIKTDVGLDMLRIA
jgi:hypothetical protein